MARINDIKLLLNRCTDDIETIKQNYNLSLQNQDILSDLKIDIKNYCENLRSALDYMAQDISELYCPDNNSKIYFPIINKQEEFANNMRGRFPNLYSNNRDLWNYLESIQPYNGGDTGWLLYFNKLNNQNKHSQLKPQTRVETPEIKVTPAKGGGGISWNPDKVRFNSKVSVYGAPVDPETQIPTPNSSVSVEKKIWVNFTYDFDGQQLSAIELLEKSLTGVKSIYNAIGQLIYGAV